MVILKKLLRAVTYLLILAIVVSFFLKGRLTPLKSYSQESYLDPIQKELTGSEHVRFTDNGFDYDINPTHSYEITGVVVSKMGYSLFGDPGPDKTAPYDLCIVWGDNIKNKTYLAPGTSFGQDQRFCFYRYSGDTTFNNQQLSNNHLVIQNKSLIGIEKSINVGDEIQITGSLVRLSAQESNGGSRSLTWNSSTTRQDTGNGACEVILANSIKVITRAHPIAYYTFLAAPYILVLTLIIRFMLLLIEIRTPKEKKVKIDFFIK